MSSAGFIGALLLRPLLLVDDIRPLVPYPPPLDLPRAFDRFLAESCVKPTYAYCHPDVLTKLEMLGLAIASDDQPDAMGWFKLTNQSD